MIYVMEGSINSRDMGLYLCVCGFGFCLKRFMYKNYCIIGYV